MSEIQREFKDRLFIFLFGSQLRRDWTLSLYNGVNHSHYGNPQDIETMTIGEILYLGMRNDVAFLLSGFLNLYEQQATWNPNMPIRFLLYLARIYEKYIYQNKLNLFSEKLLSLPVPQFAVFYNGTKEQPDERILLLSDLFDAGLVKGNPSLELRVRMININRGRNPELMKACRPLAEYSWLIGEIRNNQARSWDLGHAVDMALDDMPKDYLIRECLMENRVEVKGMVLEELDQDWIREVIRKEAWEDGLEAGREEGREAGRRETSKIYDAILAERDRAMQEKDREIQMLRGKLGLA